MNATYDSTGLTGYDLHINSNSGKAIYPPGPLLDRYMGFARSCCESEDNLLLAAVLPICSAILGRKVWFDFGSRMYPNIYTMLAARAGFRKSTCVKLVETIASRILTKDRFLSGQASEEALFYEYDPENGGCCDKLLIEDEGNTILTNWSNSQYGKIVSKRMLSLHDCKSWRQSFKQNLKDGDSVVKQIDETSTNILIAATLGVAGFSGLDAKDGMQRRFLTYLSENLARTIYLPKSTESQVFEELCMDFSLLDRLEGKISFSDSAFEKWKEIQDENRKAISGCGIGKSFGGEMLASTLATEPTHTLKIAMIFACLRIVSRNSGNPGNSSYSQESEFYQDSGDSGIPEDSGIPGNYTMIPDDLIFANAHVRQCIRDAIALDGVSERSGIREDAERIYDTILATTNPSECFFDELGKFVKMSKSQLTSKFANDTRRGGMTVDRLYNKILPNLINQKKCLELERDGKKRVYGFLLEE